MQKFSELGITSTTKGFIGDKIKIDRILNKQIVVHEHRIEDSKFDKGNGKCLHMQIEVDGTKKVVFSGSGNLIDMIQKVPKQSFPFETTIIKDDERLIFT